MTARASRSHAPTGANSLCAPAQPPAACSGASGPERPFGLLCCGGGGTEKLDPPAMLKRMPSPPGTTPPLGKCLSRSWGGPLPCD
eukprot:2062199-Rhodomonas_salina.1